MEYFWSGVFVCVEVLRPSQPSGVMSSAVSLPNHTFTGRLTSIVHILSPETDNCPSWINGRERMTVENISWSISTKECADFGGDWTRDLLVSSRTAHPTEPPRPAGLVLQTSKHAERRKKSMVVLKRHVKLLLCLWSLPLYGLIQQPTNWWYVSYYSQEI